MVSHTALLRIHTAEHMLHWQLLPVSQLPQIYPPDIPAFQVVQLNLPFFLHSDPDEMLRYVRPLLYMLSYLQNMSAHTAIHLHIH